MLSKDAMLACYAVLGFPSFLLVKEASFAFKEVGLACYACPVRVACGASVAMGRVTLEKLSGWRGSNY